MSTLLESDMSTYSFRDDVIYEHSVATVDVTDSINGSHHSFSVDRSTVVLGRVVAPGHIALSIPSISRCHCKLHVYPGNVVFIEDLGSANGTFLLHSNSPSIRLHKNTAFQVASDQQFCLGSQKKVICVVKDVNVPVGPVCSGGNIIIAGTIPEDIDVPYVGISSTHSVAHSAVPSGAVKMPSDELHLLEMTDTPNGVPAVDPSTMLNCEIIAEERDVVSTLLTCNLKPLDATPQKRQISHAKDDSDVDETPPVKSMPLLAVNHTQPQDDVDEAPPVMRKPTQLPSTPQIPDALPQSVRTEVASGRAPSVDTENDDAPVMFEQLGSDSPVIAIGAMQQATNGEDVSSTKKRDRSTEVPADVECESPLFKQRQPPSSADAVEVKESLAVGAPMDDDSKSVPLITLLTSAAVKNRVAPTVVVSSVVAAVKTVTWQYKIDLRKADDKNEAWSNYSAADSGVIEAGHQVFLKSSKRKVVAKLNAQYSVHFKDLVQFRVEDRSRQRPVRRVEQ